MSGMTDAQALAAKQAFRCRLMPAIAKILVLARRLWAGLVFDGLISGNHRRGRAGATPGCGAYGAYRCAANRGGGWGPGHTGNVGAAHTLAILRNIAKGSAPEP